MSEAEKKNANIDAEPEMTLEQYRKAKAERIASEVMTLDPSEIRDLLPAEERARRLAEAERLERELMAELEKEG